MYTPRTLQSASIFLYFDGGGHRESVMPILLARCDGARVPADPHPAFGGAVTQDVTPVLQLHVDHELAAALMRTSDTV